MYHNDLERESLDFPKQENNQSVLNASFVKEMICIIHQMYRQGWDERNGGNVSYRIDEDDVRRCLDVDDVKRVLPFNFDASKLIGQYFILTGTGKYFRNVVKSPETVLGIIRIAKDGHSAELLWGFEDGGSFTSEFPAHMMCHIKRMAVDSNNRVVMHCHPTNLLAICGTNEIGEATSDKMKEYRVVIWGMHGVYACGKDLDETFGLVETVEKAAQVYMLTFNKPRVNTIKDEELVEIANFFGVKYKKDFLG